METQKKEDDEERAPENANTPEYATPSKYQALWVTLGLALPLFGCLVYGYLTR